MTKEKKESILERIALIIDTMMGISGMSYPECYNLLSKTNVYRCLIEEDFATLYDSPEALLVELDKELQKANHHLGGRFSENAIKAYLLSLRKQNLSLQGKV